jgi:hypothetical protein
MINKELFTLLYREEEITCYDDGYLTALGLLLRGRQKVNYLEVASHRAQ